VICWIAALSGEGRRYTSRRSMSMRRRTLRLKVGGRRGRRDDRSTAQDNSTAHEGEE
jgi:hypothetical protein